MTDSLPFWQTKSLIQMTPEEWKSLCDGCGRCCTHKLQDDDTNEIIDSNEACQLLDLTHCRCSNYTRRSYIVPDCLPITPHQLAKKTFRHWLPVSCAYRLLAEKKQLPFWHPLISGTSHSVEKAGISMKGLLVHAKN